MGARAVKKKDHGPAGEVLTQTFRCLFAGKELLEDLNHTIHAFPGIQAICLFSQEPQLPFRVQQWCDPSLYKKNMEFYYQVMMVSHYLAIASIHFQ